MVHFSKVDRWEFQLGESTICFAVNLLTREIQIPTDLWELEGGPDDYDPAQFSLFQAMRIRYDMYHILHEFGHIYAKHQHRCFEKEEREAWDYAFSCVSQKWQPEIRALATHYLEE